MRVRETDLRCHSDPADGTVGSSSAIRFARHKNLDGISDGEPNNEKKSVSSTHVLFIWVLFAVACSAHAEPPASHGPQTSTEIRCTLRISARGVYVGGDLASRADAVAFCRRKAGAMVILEDGAPEAVWSDRQADLRREGVAVYMRGPLGHKECLDNPLAKGCN